MPDYPGKLLELKGVEYISENYYLHIRLHHRQDFDLLWKVDNSTADNIKSIFKSDSRYRYRISFSKPTKPVENQFLGILTQTFRDESEQFFFMCSEEYMTNLNHIRNCENIGNLNEKVFSNLDLSPLKNPALDEQHTSDDEPVKRNYKIAYYSIAILTLIGLLSWRYFFPMESKASFNEEASAQSAHATEQSDPEIELEIETEEKQPEIIDAEVGEDLAEETQDDENPSDNMDIALPNWELEKLKSYEVPKGMVALTFDDGPSIYSKKIVDILNEYEIGGTFFAIGRNVKKYPDELKYIYDNGYSIGSHTMNHVNLANASQDKLTEEVYTSMELLKEITGTEPVLFRPPYGSYNKKFEKLIEDNQYKIVLWNNDPEDWKVQNADKILQHIKNTKTSGAIILLHETKPVTDALPRIIEYLQGLDLEIVSLK